MPSLKTIKTKIKSTGNLKKISRALEIISTIKLQKNKTKVEAAKQYFLDLTKLIAQVSSKLSLFDTHIPWTSSKDLVIVVSSEKWLCGGINSKITKLVSLHYNPDHVDVFAIGKKAYEFCKRTRYNIVGYLNLKDEIVQKDITPLLVFLEGQGKQYQHIDIVFNYFQSILTQIPSQLRLYPMTQSHIIEFLHTIGAPQLELEHSHTSFNLLEPDRETVQLELQRQMRNYLITATILQNKIAEHASRMIAMKNAKDNCTKFIGSLTLQFNKLRQAIITKEISEITAAKIAME